jgi:type II secretory pathway pseudopilin PulG
LVAIGVIAVVLSILLPALRLSRDRAIALKCQANLRSVGSLVAAYSIDYKDYFPTRISDGQEVSSRPWLWKTYALQGQAVFSSPMWRHYAGSSVDRSTYRCPANATVAELGDKAWVDFEASPTLHAEPGYLHPDLPETSWRGKFGGRAQMLGSVLFPASKVGLMEWWVWHGWRRGFTTGGSIDGLYWTVADDRPGSVWFLDGSTSACYFADALPGVVRGPEWHSAPVYLTASGVRGRDFVR